MSTRTSGLTVTHTIRFGQAPDRAKPATTSADSSTASALSKGRIPRIARLMALAIHFDGLIKAGKIKDYAELARVGHVTRARLTQIMNLLNLAPDIQEQLLFLPPVTQGRDSIKEWQLRPIAAIPNWRRQRLKAKSLRESLPRP